MDDKKDEDLAFELKNKIQELFDEFESQYNGAGFVGDAKHNMLLFPILTIIIRYCAKHDITPEKFFEFFIRIWSTCPAPEVRQKLEHFISDSIKQSTKSFNN